ncbi:MAG: hypothetical protein ACYTGC_13175 [Planctomycetota bacterium]|jgi:ketosteroid isomerase-like protein
MPDPPHVSLITRVVFEHPWPLTIVLLAAAGALTWTGLRGGLTRRLPIAVLLAAIGGGLVLVATLVVTSGELARQVTRDFVEAVVTSDVVRAVDLIAVDGALTIGAPTNPGWDKDSITTQLSNLDRIAAIGSNRITRLDAYSATPDEGVVHLACWTEGEGNGGVAVTQWVLRVRRQADGEWRIHRLTWISLNGQPASDRALRW